MEKLKETMLFKINLENSNYRKKSKIVFDLLKENIHDISLEDDEKHKYIINDLQEIRRLKQLIKENNSRKLSLEQQLRDTNKECNNSNPTNNESWIYDYDSDGRDSTSYRFLI